MDRHKQMIKTSISVGIFQVCSKSSTLAGNQFLEEWKLRAVKLKSLRQYDLESSKT